MSTLSPPETVTTTAEEDREAVVQWLAELGMTLGELRAEAEEGVFSSEAAANAWFFIEGLVV